MRPQQHTDPRTTPIVGPNTYDALVQAGAFRTLTRTWGKKIALEVGAVKEFYCTPDRHGMDEAIEATLASVRAVERGGGRVSYLAMDEPFLSGLSARCGGPSLIPTADRLALYMKAVNRAYPAIRSGLWGENGNADALFSADAMKLERAVESAFSTWDALPQHLIVQSWAESSGGLRITPTNLPEDRADTHTEVLMRVFLRLFATRSRNHAQVP